jgi:hypothetical protein
LFRNIEFFNCQLFRIGYWKIIENIYQQIQSQKVNSVFFIYFNKNLFLELSLKPTVELLNELSFLTKTHLPIEVMKRILVYSNLNFLLFQSDNFSYIDESLSGIQTDEPDHSEPIPPCEIKEEIEITPKTDSGHGDDETSSNSSHHSWQIEDGNDDYDSRFMKLSQSMKILEKQFENDFLPFVNNEKNN